MKKSNLVIVAFIFISFFSFNLIFAEENLDRECSGCIDSDGGINYYVRGSGTSHYCNFTSSGGGWIDRCFDSKTLIEYYCDSNVTAGWGFERYNCSLGCADGACINDSKKENNVAMVGGGKIKILPETASLRARERLGELRFNITLKEVGKDNETKTIYGVSGEKQGKMLGLFKVKGKVSIEVDAETGEVVKVHKPWWAFLASGI